MTTVVENEFTLPKSVIRKTRTSWYRKGSFTRKLVNTGLLSYAAVATLVWLLSSVMLLGLSGVAALLGFLTFAVFAEKRRNVNANRMANHLKSLFEKFNCEVSKQELRALNYLIEIAEPKQFYGLKTLSNRKFIVQVKQDGSFTATVTESIPVQEQV